MSEPRRQGTRNATKIKKNVFAFEESDETKKRSKQKSKRKYESDESDTGNDDDWVPPSKKKTNKRANKDSNIVNENINLVNSTQMGTFEIINIDEEEDELSISYPYIMRSYSDVPVLNNFVDGRLLVTNNLYEYKNLIIGVDFITADVNVNGIYVPIRISAESIDHVWAVVAKGWESFGWTVDRGIPELAELPPEGEVAKVDVAILPNIQNTDLSHAQFYMTLLFNTKTPDKLLHNFNFINRVDIEIPNLKRMQLNTSPTFVLIPNHKDDEIDLGGARRTRQRIAEKKEEIKNPIPNDTIVDYNNIKLSFEHLARINEGDQLNDTLIDIYMEYCKDRFYRDGTQGKPKIHIFHTTFYPLLKKDIKRAAVRYPKDTALYEKDVIFIPFSEDGHWMLMVVFFPGDKEKRSIMYCDSMSERSPDFSLFQQYFQLRYQVEHTGTIQEELPVFRQCSASLPQQEGEIDCGLFVLENIERIMKNIPSMIPIRNAKWYTVADIENKRKYIRNKIMSLHVKKMFPKNKNN